MLWLVALPPPGFGTFATEPAAQAERLSRTSYSGDIDGGEYIKKNDDEMDYDIINNKYDSSEACSDYAGWEAKDYTEYMLEFYSFGLTPDLKHYSSRGCSVYNEFCPVLTGKEEDASADGIKAKDACCGCGGGISAGRCEAIGYKQDDGMGKACEASGYEQ